MTNLFIIYNSIQVKLFWNGLAAKSYQKERYESIESGIAFPVIREAKLTSVQLNDGSIFLRGSDKKYLTQQDNCQSSVQHNHV